jgi:hypothetical protein
MSNILLNIFFISVHTVGFIYLLIILLISNNLKYCLLTLIFMIIIKYSYVCLNECLITPLESNIFFPSSTELAQSVLNINSISLQKCEEILINFLLVLISIKIIFLIFYKYCNNTCEEYLNVLNIFELFKHLKI